MKKLVVVFTLCIALTGYTQDLKNWQVGINMNPFLFTRINSNFSYEKGKQNFPNGFGYGITIEKNWNDHWGIKTGMEYSKQNEKYFEKPTNSEDYNTLKSTFGYLKVPISIQYYYPLKENLFLTFNQGIQFSFLKYLNEVWNNNGMLIETITLDNYQIIDNIDPSYNKTVSYKQIIYNESLIGITGSIGLKGFLTKKISYSTNLRYEFDLSNSDTDRYIFVKGFNGSNSTSTHNFRLGLELGLQYNFSLAGCSYCPK